MLLMLGSPICLYLMAYVLFPEPNEHDELDEYYLSRAQMIWPLAGLTVIIGTLFRPLAFGDALWDVDNASGIPILLVCAVLAISRHRVVHGILVPIVLASVLLDTLTFSHSIG